MNDEKEFIKNTKPRSGLLIWAIIIVSSCIILEFLAYRHLQETKNDPAILSDISKEGEYTCIDVDYMTDYFASREGKKKIYFLFDLNYIYAVNLNKNAEKRLQKILDYSYDPFAVEKPDTVKVCGTTRLIDPKLKELAIDSYNEIFDKEFLDRDNFEDYLTSYYIDTDSEIDANFLYQSLLLTFFSLIGLSLLYTYFKNAKTLKETLNLHSHEMEKIKSEAVSSETLYYKKSKLYLTKDYIINLAHGFEIYKYEDIVWVYPYELRQNGYVTNKFIYVVTKDSKVHPISTLTTNKKNNAKYDEIYRALLIKVPNALEGYTEDNAEKAKDRYKKV